MRIPIVELAVLTSILLTTGTAFSKEESEDKHHHSKWRGKLLKQYDMDGDGKLDDEERKAMKKAWAKKWKKGKEEWNKVREKYDENGDGKLSDDERRALRKAMAKKWGKHGKMNLGRHLIAYLDENKDGKISMDEVPERFHKHFENVDADSDGVVNKKEINNAVKKAKTKFVSHMQNRIFDKMDQNDDGKLDIDKIIAKLHEGMKKIDTSDDGFIDKSEFKEFTNPSPTEQDSELQQRDQVQAELARLRQAIEKLTESLKDREKGE